MNNKIVKVCSLIFIFSMILQTSNCNNKVTGLGLVIGHGFVDFPMTDEEITAARNTKLYFEHASVGGNISDGLDALAAGNSKYSRTNFVFSNRGNPGADAKADGFYNRLTANTPNPSSYTALMYKFCYIDNGGDMDSLFNKVSSQMVDLESKYPENVFIWWTMPLQTTGDANRDRYNLLIRRFCKENNRILFDIADIESHETTGALHTDGGYEAMVDAYSSDGGHLNSTGYNRVAKAFWYMAYRVKKGIFF
jgi:hypothetical protein